MNDDLTITLLTLLREEVQCLRSVISEFEGDKHEYVQMVKADDLRRVIEMLEVKDGSSV